MNKSETNTLDQFIRVPELCRILSVKRNTLYRLIKAGEIKPIKLRGTTVFSKQHIINYMSNKAKA